MVKYDVNKIDEIMRKYGYDKVNLNKLPTWHNHKTNEGLQINLNNEIVSFIAKHGERDLTIPDSIEMQRIKREIQLSNEPKKEIIIPPVESLGTEAKPLSIVQPTDTKFVNQISMVLEGTRIIVPQDIEELQKMTTYNRILLFQRTPTQFIKYLDKKKERPYVEGNVMKMEANIAFLFTMNSKIDGWEIRDNAVACWGSIKVNIDGKEVIVSGVGIDKQIYKDSNPERPIMTIPEMMKNANTDLKKKCLADLGFNNDVYRNDIRPEEPINE
jgi:hypothetical protein